MFYYGLPADPVSRREHDFRQDETEGVTERVGRRDLFSASFSWFFIIILLS